MHRFKSALPNTEKAKPSKRTQMLNKARIGHLADNRRSSKKICAILEGFAFSVAKTIICASVPSVRDKAARRFINY
ncbi:hypothetical protein [Prevotella sp. HUN102]|uniref:hypothetical protein n=1 Tax=Prevotella sp. HUN102 TaxID=1392486 RepID=UPI000AFF4D70|nr:hypothetical protein [Prevotella sp. HUN102]